MKKIISSVLSLTLLGLTLVGCAAKTSENISVISREEGSGTRGAFVELLGIEEKDADGNKVDKTTEEATIAKGTDVVITQVSSDKNSIGYISLGSLNDLIKPLKVNGVEAKSENVKNGSYSVSRPFNIAVKDGISEVAQDFIDFILSEEGQKIVEGNKYIPIEAKSAYKSTDLSGKIVVAGSSSVSPVMEKLSEAYKALNKNVTIEIQTSDSSSGMKAAMDGTCDIGMASRELKDSEAELKAIVIALDGIAVVVNKENALTDLTSEQIKKIYTGDIKTWSEVK